jgi:hypothetical protein
LEALKNLSKEDPQAVPTPLNDDYRDETNKEWRMYCRVYADSVSKLSEDHRNTVRFEMEKMLFEANREEKKEEERQKHRKRKAKKHSQAATKKAAAVVSGESSVDESNGVLSSHSSTPLSTSESE